MAGKVSRYHNVRWIIQHNMVDAPCKPEEDWQMWKNHHLLRDQAHGVATVKHAIKKIREGVAFLNPGTNFRRCHWPATLSLGKANSVILARGIWGGQVCEHFWWASHWDDSTEVYRANAWRQRMDKRTFWSWRSLFQHRGFFHVSNQCH